MGLDAIIANPLRCKWPDEHAKPGYPQIEDMEDQEAEAWFAYLRTSRDYHAFRRAGWKAEAKKARRSAVMLHSRHAKTMHRIMVLHRQRIFGMARRRGTVVV